MLVTIITSAADATRCPNPLSGTVAHGSGGDIDVPRVPVLAAAERHFSAKAPIDRNSKCRETASSRSIV
jgi:hypothetical protein